MRSLRDWGRLAGLALTVALALPAAAQDFPLKDFPPRDLPPKDFPPTPAFSDVRVDVRPLLAKGAGVQAEVMAADLTAALRKSFSGRIGGRGPALVVVIDSLSLRPYVGGGGGRFGFGGSQTDYMEGAALLVGRGGAVLGRHPQLTATPSSYGGAWYDPQYERRRLAAIADIYAQWLARDLPK